MKNFEEFKASREKMDPSARKMSEHQWVQAYSAYCSSRERARGGASSRESSRSRRSSSSSTDAVQGIHRPSNVSAAGALKAHIRQESAYADLRLIVNLLSWVLIGAMVVLGLLQMLVYTSPAAAGVALLRASISVILVVVLRQILHVLIDIPDIALYREYQSRKSTESADSVGED